MRPAFHASTLSNNRPDGTGETSIPGTSRKSAQRGPECRNDRWLSQKPLSVPVHQLVVGGHHQNRIRIARSLGGELQYERDCSPYLPPLIAQRNLAALRDSHIEKQRGRRVGTTVMAHAGTRLSYFAKRPGGCRPCRVPVRALHFGRCRTSAVRRTECPGGGRTR